MSDFYGTWTVLQNTPMGKMEMQVTIADDNGSPAVAATSKMVRGDVVDASIEGDTLTAVQKLTKPIPAEVNLTFTLTSPTTFEGTAKSKMFPPFTLNGSKVS